MNTQGIFGYAGKILRMDLTGQTIQIEPTTNYAREWLGGSGLAQWIIYNEVKPWVTPYAPANRLIFSAGPLNGTLAPGASRLSADSINALTLGVGSSNSCGHFSSELKFAGYDHIILQGKARTPVYLWIEDDRVELRDARHLWGKTTWETDVQIKEELGDLDIQVLSIGPAGENVVRGACIIVNRNRALGRCGLGGIMGSKNLKAVAVKGTGEIRVADPARFIKALDGILARFEDSEFVKRHARFGTPGGVVVKQNTCGIPYKNFQDLTFPEESYAKWDLEQFRSKYFVRNMGYLSCPAPCSRYYRIDQGPYAGLETEGFQFEVLANFAGKLAVDDPAFCIKVNAYCNQLGLDVDNPAGAIGWAMECYQRGILNDRDTDGIPLHWGDSEVVLELIRKMAWREGFGNLLGEGCAHAAELLGRDSDYYAIHLKGQDLYEVLRSYVGWALGTCVSTRGGGHTTGAPVSESIASLSEEIAQRVYGVKSLHPLSFEDKAQLVGYFEILHRINNAFGVCHMNTTWFDPDLQSLSDFAELYSAATGWETSVDDLRRAAIRILNVEKAFNILHANFSRRDDYPPPRCLEEPIPSGRAKGFRLEREKWDRLLDEYYEMHTWDKKTGFPTRKCLDALDLKQVADDLERVGRLGS